MDLGELLEHHVHCGIKQFAGLPLFWCKNEGDICVKLGYYRVKLAYRRVDPFPDFLGMLMDLYNQYNKGDFTKRK